MTVSPQKSGARIALMATALGLNAVAPLPLDAQPATVSAQTAKGQTVLCMARSVQPPGGPLGTCTLARDTAFSNSYGVSPSGQGAAWTMSWPACKGGFAVSFDNRGNVRSCTLSRDVAVTNSYGASPSGWSFGFSCRANATISFDAIGHINACTSAQNQSVNNVQCPRNAQISVSGNGAVSCVGGGGAGGGATTTVTGGWRMNFVFNGGNYPYSLTLNQQGSSLTGKGTFPAGAASPQYAWAVGPGSVNGDRISFTARYTLGTQATMQVTGRITAANRMSGTWTDDVGGGRQGTWTAVR